MGMLTRPGARGADESAGTPGNAVAARKVLLVFRKSRLSINSNNVHPRHLGIGLSQKVLIGREICQVGTCHFDRETMGFALRVRSDSARPCTSKRVGRSPQPSAIFCRLV